MQAVYLAYLLAEWNMSKSSSDAPIFHSRRVPFLSAVPAFSISCDCDPVSDNVAHDAHIMCRQKLVRIGFCFFCLNRVYRMSQAEVKEAISFYWKDEEFSNDLKATLQRTKDGLAVALSAKHERAMLHFRSQFYT